MPASIGLLVARVGGVSPELTARSEIWRTMLSTSLSLGRRASISAILFWISAFAEARSALRAVSARSESSTSCLWPISAIAPEMSLFCGANTSA